MKLIAVKVIFTLLSGETSPETGCFSSEEEEGAAKKGK